MALTCLETPPREYGCRVCTRGMQAGSTFVIHNVGGVSLRKPVSHRHSDFDFAENARKRSPLHHEAVEALRAGAVEIHHYVVRPEVPLEHSAGRLGMPRCLVHCGAHMGAWQTLHGRLDTLRYDCIVSPVDMPDTSCRCGLHPFSRQCTRLTCEVTSLLTVLHHSRSHSHSPHSRIGLCGDTCVHGTTDEYYFTREMCGQWKVHVWAGAHTFHIEQKTIASHGNMSSVRFTVARRTHVKATSQQ